LFKDAYDDNEEILTNGFSSLITEQDKSTKYFKPLSNKLEKEILNFFS